MGDLGKFLVFLLTIVGYFLISKYIGFVSLLIPILLIVLSYWIIKKVTAIHKTPLFLSYSLMIGHIL
jgi:hypothetical protein